MGAKYAPSLANLFMAQWEEHVVYAQRRPEVVLWARYIDDILLLWDGDEVDLSEFMCSRNMNNRGIHLSYEVSCKEFNFLDLKISVRGDSFVTSTFFKSTDRNSYIPMDSCHHAFWLRSVPKSQYMRLKRNCTEQEEFLVQAETLTQRFLEKGYLMKSLSDTLDQTGG